MTGEELNIDAGAEAAPQSPEQAQQPAGQQPSRVGYVIWRPYAAGELPEVVTAIMTSLDPPSGFATLEYEAKGVTVEKSCVPHSEGREPGTWHKLPEAPAAAGVTQGPGVAP